jgi:hypothetical protein
MLHEMEFAEVEIGTIFNVFDHFTVDDDISGVGYALSTGG